MRRASKRKGRLRRVLDDAFSIYSPDKVFVTVCDGQCLVGTACKSKTKSGIRYNRLVRLLIHTKSRRELDRYYESH